MAEYGGIGQQAGMGQMQALQQSATAKDTIGRIAAEFDRNVERLSKLCDAMRHIGDRIDGARPESVGPIGAPETPPASMVLDLRRKHVAISNLIDRCENEMQRIAVALGVG